MPKFVAWFNEIDKDDVALVGHEGGHLGEMAKIGFPIPNGFIITSKAYYEFLRENNLDVKINHLLSNIDFSNEKSLELASKNIQKHILEGDIPLGITSEIISAYNKLGGAFEYPLVTIKLSTSTEHSGNTFSENVKGDAVLLEKIKLGWASYFDSKSNFYKQGLKYDLKIGISLVIQKIIEADTSGVMFTIDPIMSDKSTIVIETNSEKYKVKKSDYVILSRGAGKILENQLIELAKLAEKIEKHYYFPQEIEWAIKDNSIYILKTKSITTTHEQTQEEDKNDTLKSDILLKGHSARPGIASGPARIVLSVKDIGNVMPDDILVIPEIDQQFLPAIKKTAGIITDNENKTSHAITILKNLGIPVIANTKNATKTLKSGNIVTVNGTKGEVYKGGFAIRQLAHSEHSADIKTATKLYVDLSNVELVEQIAGKNVDGIGLLRAESIINKIGIHPKKMIRDGKKQDFINKLSDSLAITCKTFCEKPVIYRFCDFKTNEYRNLIGGKEFEPQELNPTLGFRGAFRYIHDPEVFKLELEAIKTVRDSMGCKNLWIMLPFVRTVEELIEVKKIISSMDIGSSSNFKLWITIETPASVIMFEKFIEVGIDGISINSDSLSMLIMGVDKENFEVASELNGIYPAVSWAFEHIIKTAHKHSLTSSIFGQTLASNQELIRNLVSGGISSISVFPENINSTRKILAQTEKELLNHR